MPAWGETSGTFLAGLSHTVAGLSAGRRYEVQARACAAADADECAEATDAVEGATRPAAPAGATFSDLAATSVTLGWTAVTDNDEVIVQVGYHSDPTAAAPAEASVTDKLRTDTSHSFTGLEAGTAYKLFVRTVVKGSGETAGVLSRSDWSSVVAGLAAPQNLTVPTGVGTAQKAIALRFDEVAGATVANSQYRVKGKDKGESGSEGESETGTWSEWAVVTGAAASNGKVTGTTAANLLPGTAYDVQVRACGAGTPPNVTCGPASATVLGATPTVALSSVAAAAVVPASSSRLSLSWSVTVADGHADAGYELGWSTDTSATAPATDFDPGAALSSFADGSPQVFTGLEAATGYKLFVRTVVAYDAADGNRRTLYASAWSSAIATTAAAPVVTATAASGTRFDLEWNEVDGATHYQARHKLSTAASFDPWPTAPATFQYTRTKSVTSLAAGRRYDVEVRACSGADAAKCGPAVDVASAEAATVPAAPASLATSGISTSAITLGWAAVTDNDEAIVQVGYHSDTSADAPTDDSVTDKLRTDESHEFTGLTMNTAYKLFVRTVVKNADGEATLSMSDWVAKEETTSATNTAPEITTGYPDQELGADRSVEYPVAATDADASDTLQYKVEVDNGGGPEVTVSPTDLTDLAADSKVTVATGSTVSTTEATVTVTVTDGEAPVTKSFKVTVQTDTTPSFGSETQDDLDLTTNEAITTVTLPEATDGNGTITYSLAPALPEGLALDAATRELSGTPTVATASETYTWTATDSDGSAASLTFTIEVSDPTAPAKPANLTAVGEDTQVVLTWDDPEDSTITQWQYDQHSTGDETETWEDMTTADVTDNGDTLSYTVTGLTNGTAYTFKVRAQNAVGDGEASDDVTVTPVANSAPVFSGATDFTAAENQTTAGTVTATDANSEDAVSYAIKTATGGGALADGGKFEIDSSSGAITFKTAPDYETPTDVASTAPHDTVAGDNVYSFTVTATGGTGGREKTTDQVVTVTVTNEGETGAPVGPPAPLVFEANGADNAVRITWTAPDAVIQTVSGYNVQFRKQGVGDWNDVVSGGSTTITGTEVTIPDSALSGIVAVNETLEARVRAINDDGTGNWSSAGTRVWMDLAEVGIPAASTITIDKADVADGSVTLNWTYSCSACGPVEGFRVHYRQGSSGAWTDVDFDTSTSGVQMWSGSDVRSHTQTGLTNDTEYEFEVLARTAGGIGTAWKKSAALRPLAAVTLTATAGAEKVDLSWSGFSYGGSDTVNWLYRQKAGTGSYGEWQSICQDCAESTTTHTVTGLTGGTAYTFQVQADSSNWARASSEAPATPTVNNDPELDKTHLRDRTMGHSRELELDIDATDADGGDTLQYKAEFVTRAGKTTGTAMVEPEELTDLTDDSIIKLTASDNTGTGVRVKVTVTDGKDEDTAEFNLDFEANEAPSFSAGREDYTFYTDIAIETITLPESTGGNGTLSYELEGTLPAGLSFDASTREITGTPTAAATETYLNFEVVDDDAEEATYVFTITVIETVAPVKPANLTAVGEDTQVVLTWDDPENPTITQWQYDQQDASDTTETWENMTPTEDGDSLTHTITGLTNGTEYAFKIRARNVKGDGADSDDVTVTPLANGGPVFSGPTSFEVAENSHDVATLTAADPNPQDAVIYGIKKAEGGAELQDGAKFSIGQDSGELEFKIPPDYENPQDRADSGDTDDACADPLGAGECDNVYKLTVVAVGGADDRAMTAEQEITVRVTNEPETGAPVGPLTPEVFEANGADNAVRITWTAPDAVIQTVTGYNVQFRKQGVDPWNDVVSGGSTTITGTEVTVPDSALTGIVAVNETLEARVRAINADGTGPWSSAGTRVWKDLQETGTPAAPTVGTAVVDDGQVTVHWSHDATQFYGAAEGFRVRYREGTTGAWTDVDFDADANNVNLWNDASTSYLKTGLTNKTEYQFEVLARTAGGIGANWGQSQPVRPLADVTLAATAGAESVTLSWTGFDYGGDSSGVTWEYRQKAGTGSYGGWQEISESTGATASHKVRSLTGGTAYAFEVRSKGSGWVQASSNEVTATPTSNEPPVITAIANRTVGYGRIFHVPVMATDADGDALQFKAELSKDGTEGTASVRGPKTFEDLTNGSGSLSIEASGNTATGTATVTVTVTDGVEPATTTFTLTFEADADPTFGSETQTDLSFTKDEAITTVTLPAATGGNGDTLEYTLSPDLPAGLTFDASTRQISGTPTAVTASEEYTYQAYDHDQSAASLTFDIEVIELTVPGAPAKPTLEVGDTQLVASWNAPTNTGGAAITDYDVRYRTKDSADGDDWTDHGDDANDDASDDTTLDTALSRTITGLTNGTVYEVQVRAANSEGDGTWSDSGEGTPVAVPAKPTNLTAASGDTAVTLTWDDPDDSTITQWQYDQQSAGDLTETWEDMTTADVTDNGDTLSYTVTGLTNGTAYSFKVRGQNAAGDGAASDEATATPVANTAPVFSGATDFTAAENQTTAGTVTATDSNSEDDVSYAIKTASGGGALADGGKFNIGSSSGAITFKTAPDYENPTDVASTAPHDTVAGDNVYSFTVTATGGTGDRAKATDQVVTVTVTNEGETGAPVGPLTPDVFEANGADQAVRITWTEPGDVIGMSVNGYNVQFRKQNTGAWNDVLVSGSKTITGTEVTVPDSAFTGIVAVNEIVEARVRAINDDGTGNWSSAGTRVWKDLAEAGTPSATNVTIGKADVASGSVTLTWAFSCGFCGPVEGYRLRYRQGDSGAWTDVDFDAGTSGDQVWSGAGVTSHTVTGLTNDTEYEFEVLARTAGGIGTAWKKSAALRPLAAVTLTATAGREQADLFWSGFSYGGSDTVTWEFRQKAGTGSYGGWQEISGSTGTTTNHTVKSLTGGTQYTFQVQADASNWARASSEATATPTNNDPPEIADIANRTVGYERVFHVPVSATDAQGDALKYSAAISGSGKGTATIQSPTGEADLTNGKGDIRIQASDSTGTSATVTVTVTDGVEPATETFTLTFEANETPNFGSDTQADLSFTKDEAITTVTLPAATGGNGTVTYELVTADGTRTPATLPAGLTFDASTRQISGTPTAATASATYRYRAVDDDDGSASLDFDIEVVEPTVTVPEKPANLTAVGEDTQVVLTWDDPEDSSITGWEYQQFTEDTTGSWQPMTGATATTMTYTVTSLTNGTEYMFWIRAKNAGGNSLESDLVMATPRSNGAPVFSGATDFTVVENGTTVGSVTATDPNSQDTVSYAIKTATGGGALVDGGSFTIDSSSGAITFKSAPDYEDPMDRADSGDSNNACADPPGTGECDNIYKFTVTATGGTGDRAMATEQEVTVRVTNVAETGPAKPQSVTATPGDGVVTLAWQDPMDTSITGWHYQQKEGEGSYGNWTDLSGSGATTTTYTVRWLDNGTAYAFKVRAVNAVGNGDASDEATATPQPPAPSKPEGFTAVGGHTRVTLAWTGPEDDTITRWQYRQMAGGGSYGGWMEMSTDDEARSHVVTGLTNGATYMFKIRAVNAGGDGVESDEQTATPAAPDDDATAPGKPGAPTLVTGYAMLTANWNPPANDGGSAITSYDLEVGVLGETPTIVTGITGTTDEVKNLTGDARYRVRVRAVNGVGDGEWSDHDEVVPRSPGAPGEPRNPDLGLLAIAGGKATIRLDWHSLSRNGGSPITSYRLVVSDPTDTADPPMALGTVTHHGCQDFDAPPQYGEDVQQCSAEVADLDAGGSYRLSLAATNGHGTGPAYEFTETLPSSTPPAPTGLQAVSRSHTQPMRLTFSAITAGEGNQVTYEIQRKKAGSSTWDAPGRTHGQHGDTTKTFTYGGDSGFEPGMWDFRVRARQHRDGLDCTTCYDGHWGPWSAVAQGTVPELPGKPENLAVQLLVDEYQANFILAWDEPVDGGKPVTAWWVDYQNLSTGDEFRVDKRGRIFHNTESGQRSKLYEARVRGRNAGGAGAASAPLRFLVAKPIEPQATAIGKTSTTLEWSEPSSSDIDPLEVETRWLERARLASVSGQCTADLKPTSSGRITSGTPTVEVGGLTQDTAYCFRIRLHLHHPGASPAVKFDLRSAWLRVKTRGLAAPGGFTTTAVSASPTTIAVGWSKPAANGADITGYEIEWRHISYGDGFKEPAYVEVDGADTTSKTITVTPTFTDARKEAYYVRVRARASWNGEAINGEWTASNSVPGFDFLHAPGSVRAMAGSGSVQVSWQPPEEDSGAGGEGPSGQGASGQSAAGQGASGQNAALDTSDLSYEVAWTPAGSDWSAGDSQQVSTTSATVEGLTNGQSYAFRVRARQGERSGSWSETVEAAPSAAATLIKELPDLSLANRSTHALDLSEHFSGEGLGYVVMVTTTHKRTGEVRTGALGEVARNKVTGVWAEDVLTLTAGPEGEHVLTLEVTATDAEGGTARDSFRLTVGVEDEEEPSVPGQPGAPTVTAGAGKVTVAWTAPADGGGTSITSYDLDAVVKGEDWNAEPRLTGLTGTTAEVTNLTNGTEYAVRVRAVNEAGAGAWSEAAHATTLIAPFADLSLANRSTHALDLSEHFSGSGLGYVVMVTTTHKGTGEVRTKPLNEVARNKVTGVWAEDVLTLTAGPEGEHVLTLEVTATDAEGGTARDDFRLTVGAPEAPTVTAGSTKVTVNWSVPEDDGGSGVTSYDLDVVVKGEEWNAEPRLTGLTETTAEVTELTNGTEYAFRVRAVNDAGAEEWSEAAYATPSAAARLIEALPDLLLANGATHELDLSEHFSGEGLGYVVMVTTTHKRTGEVRTGALGEVARNKVTGVWSGEVLTLTAGPEGEHALTLEVTATDAEGGTARDGFELTVGVEGETGVSGAPGEAPAPSKVVDEETLRSGVATFARLVSVDAVEVLGSRFAGTGESRRVSLGGRNLHLGGAGSPAGLRQGMAEEPARVGEGFGGGSGASSSVWSAHPWLEEPGAWGEPEPDTVDSLSELVGRSEFEWRLSAEEESGGGTLDRTWTAWGRVDVSGVSGGGGSGASGRVVSSHVGMESRGEGLLAGLALSHAAGSLGLGGSGHELEGEVTSVLPYVHWERDAGMSAWGLAGLGRGEASVGVRDEDEVEWYDTGLGYGLAGAGARWSLSGVGLDLKTDGLFARAETEETEHLPGLGAEVNRLRLALEGRRMWSVPVAGSVEASAELGLRLDGGDAERGFGLETAGGLGYRHPMGLSGEARGRYLLAHESRGLDEWGASVSLRLDPGAGGEGPWFAWSPMWGQAQSGVEALWAGPVASGGSPGALGRGMGLTLGYGLPARLRVPGVLVPGRPETSSAFVWRRGLWTPYGEWSHGESGTTRLNYGVRLNLGLTPGVAGGGGVGEHAGAGSGLFAPRGSGGATMTLELSGKRGDGAANGGHQLRLELRYPF